MASVSNTGGGDSKNDNMDTTDTISKDTGNGKAHTTVNVSADKSKEMCDTMPMETDDAMKNATSGPSGDDIVVVPPSGNSHIDTNSGGASVMDISIKDVEDYLLKCTISLKKDADDIMLEMQWEGGTNKESMCQVMQYFKNNLK